VLPIVFAIQEGKREPYQTNGHTIHLGHYTLDRIDADGTVKAGCHIIPFEEVEYIAGQLGVKG